MRMPSNEVPKDLTRVVHSRQLWLQGAVWLATACLISPPPPSRQADDRGTACMGQPSTFGHAHPVCAVKWSQPQKSRFFSPASKFQNAAMQATPQRCCLLCSHRHFGGDQMQILQLTALSCVNPSPFSVISAAPCGWVALQLTQHTLRCVLAVAL